MPFQHDIAGGSGNLVVSQIQSPNYDPALNQGWQINKDGTATFFSINIPGVALGAKVTFSSAAPVSPNVGDLWYDVSNGLILSQWNGSVWAPHQYGANAIANNAITNAQLNSSVTARSIGGITTTISGTAPASPKDGDLWINSSNGNVVEQASGGVFTPIVWTATSVLSAATITGSLIAAATISGGNIAAHTIQASNIQAGTITANEIAANTITAAKLVSNIVVAGIVDSTTITGATIIADGASGQILVYSGAPATGNLVASISGTSGTDGHSNPYVAGLAAYVKISTDIYAVQLNQTGGGSTDPGLSVQDQTNAPAVAGGFFSRTSSAVARATVYSGERSAGDDPGLISSFSGQSAGFGDSKSQNALVATHTTIGQVGTTSAAFNLFDDGSSPLLTLKGPLVMVGESTPSTSSGNAVAYGTSAGRFQVVDGADGNTYTTQRRTLVSAGTTITTGGNTIFSFPVSVGSYRLQGTLFLTAGSTSETLGVEFSVGTGGSCAVSLVIVRSTALYAGFSALVANSMGTFSQALSSATTNGYQCLINGVITVATAGTFSLIMETSTSTCTVVANSFLDIMPV